MHSQQDGLKVHLNVILFGEPNWANDAQNWLPMQNSNKPVLLSSESIDPTGFDVNALEALMADKNSWLSASYQPIVTKKWFIGSVLSAFFVVFIGLMAWQYPQHIMEIFNSEALHTSQENTINATPNDEQNTEIVIADRGRDDEATQLSLVQSEVNLTDTLLVAKWDSYNQANKSVTLEQAVSINNLKTKEQSATLPQLGDEQGSTSFVPLTPESERTEKAVDFQVPDIISVEQLDARLDDDIAQKAQLAKVEEASLSPIAQDPKPLASIAQASQITKYKFDENMLLSLPTDKIVLQLSGIQNPVVLQNYLNNNDLKANTWVYETQR